LRVLDLARYLVDLFERTLEVVSHQIPAVIPRQS
jgi:hypothetical protein